jgi:hypothetical protein
VGCGNWCEGRHGARMSQSDAFQNHGAKNALRLALLAALVLLVGGCATQAARAPLPASVNLVGLLPSPERVSIVDLRTEEARRSRIIEANGTYSYFGDRDVEPPPVDLLNSSIARTLPEAFHLSSIELTRLDLGFWTTEKLSLQSTTPIFMVQGAPPGANIVGNLLGQAVVAAIRAALPTGVRDAAVANIEFRVGTFPVTSIEVVAIQGPITATQALETAVSRALKNISGKIDAMKYWDLEKAVR